MNIYVGYQFLILTKFILKILCVSESKAVLYNEPFQCCVLPSILKDSQFLEGLKDELLDQIFYDKNNDLYKFQQVSIFAWMLR